MPVLTTSIFYCKKLLLNEELKKKSVGALSPPTGGQGAGLEIPYRISSCSRNIALHVHPESKHHVHDYRRSEG